MVFVLNMQKMKRPFVDSLRKQATQATDTNPKYSNARWTAKTKTIDPEQGKMNSIDKSLSLQTKMKRKHTRMPIWKSELRLNWITNNEMLFITQNIKRVKAGDQFRKTHALIWLVFFRWFHIIYCDSSRHWFFCGKRIFFWSVFKIEYFNGASVNCSTHHHNRFGLSLVSHMILRWPCSRDFLLAPWSQKTFQLLLNVCFFLFLLSTSIRPQKQDNL